jgi:hypothetical protein
VRTDNGFPTTKRELDAFETRQEANLKILAESMGVVMPNKKREEAKVRLGPRDVNCWGRR